MKRSHLFTFIGIVIVLGAVLIILKYQNRGYSKEWYACTTTSECVKVSAICGDVDSVNSQYQKVYKKHMQKLAEVSSCVELSVTDKVKNRLKVPSCVKNRCEAVSASDAL